MNNKIRYTLVKRQGDKIFKDYINSLVEVMREKSLIIRPVKHLPRKLKKTLKRLGSWEFELFGHNMGETSCYLNFKDGNILTEVDTPLMTTQD